MDHGEDGGVTVDVSSTLNRADFPVAKEAADGDVADELADQPAVMVGLAVEMDPTSKA